MKNHDTDKAFSVVIPVYNDPEGLRTCLTALAQQSFPMEKVEVLVVDNGSKDPALKIVEHFGFATCLHEPSPGSYKARNAACAVAQGDLIAFTDADCIPDKDWLENAYGHFADNHQLQAIGGRVSLVLSEAPGAAECYEKVFAFRQSKYISENGFSVTANLIVRRDVFHRIGMFNDTVRSGGDRDWGHRLYMSGGKMEYAPDTVVRHPARATLRALVHKRRRVEAGRDAIPPLKKKLPEWAPVSDTLNPAGLAMGVALAFNPSRVGLRQPQGLKVLVVAGLLTAAGWAERLRLKLGGNPLR